MNSTGNDYSFWGNIETELETEVKKARLKNRRVGGVSLFWHLFLSPILSFVRWYLLSANLFKGRKGYREAVQKAILLFSVNARLYELQHGDYSLLEKIKRDWT